MPHAGYVPLAFASYPVLRISFYIILQLAVTLGIPAMKDILISTARGLLYTFAVLNNVKTLG
jgi:hypothetical protein